MAVNLEALRELVAAEKADGPLAPVTVLVPNNIAGLFVRRHLARGVTEGLPGIAGIFVSNVSRSCETGARPIGQVENHPPAIRTATRVVADDPYGWVIGPICDL
jgi:ATP-dependent helicase/nuclease subunit B